ncbi:MAG: endonuclease/exonuclease/phosphatase family protein [Planctomycetes bacterium]|nr:endonuclease/exonuclease/phosphatase family protein [Planctomycetota bacterium]
MPFKLLTYNTTIKCNGSPEEKKKVMEVASFLKTREADIVILNELGGMDEENGIFSIFKRQAGYEYGEIFPSNNEKSALAILSREPFDSIYHEGMDFFWHSCRHIHYPHLDLAVFPTYLTPKDTNARNLEADLIQEIVASTEASKILLAGTLNALPPEFSLEEDSGLAEQDKGVMKYTNSENRICYHVINKMNSIFIDASSHQPNPNTAAYTVPTASNKNSSYIQPMRLDYVFLSNNLQDNLLSCNPVYDEVTDTLSDHYPIEAVFSSI